MTCAHISSTREDLVLKERKHDGYQIKKDNGRYSMLSQFTVIYTLAFLNVQFQKCSTLNLMQYLHVLFVSQKDNLKSCPVSTLS